MAIKILLIVLIGLAICCEAKLNKKSLKEQVGSGDDSSNKLLKKFHEKVSNKTIYGVTDNTEDGSGDDDDEDLDDLESGSGTEGSGIEIVTTTPSPTKKATKMKPKSKSTTELIVDINIYTTKSTKFENTTTVSSNDTSVTSQPLTTNLLQQVDKQVDGQPAGINFTLGIIIGVVVGAVLAILVIIFLVYRLRKKDEGSYSLEEQSTQAFITNDGPQKTEKEVYA